MTEPPPVTDARVAEARPADLPPLLSWIYSSFASEPGGGNPAGVVLSSSPLATAEAQAIAAALSVPTTGFVTGPAVDERVVDVRFFTPEQEIDACGHVTIAIATALVERGIWQRGDEVTVRARGGESPLSLRDDAVAMEQRLRVLELAAIDWAEVEATLGPLKRHTSLPLAVAGTGLRHLIVPLADVAQLATLELDASRIATLARRVGVDTIGVWAALEPGRIRLRDLCSSIGALEEPASGTTSGALALYLTRNGWLKGDALIVEQGIEMRRPSRIDVTVTSPDSVVVCGRASRLSGPCRSPNEARGRGGLPDAIADLKRALVGRELPDLTLASTVLPVNLRELGAERLVLFLYPHATGLAEPPVPGWDSIPGARGCTAQSCGFRDQHARFAELGAEVVGLSVQTTSEQRGFAERVGLRYRLISDPNLLLATTLGLPTFVVSGCRLYRRLTLVAEQGVIVKVFDPVAAPAENAAEVVRWLESREIQPGSSDGGS
jgi:PhzF family phenazine biosynthesis protein